MTAVIPDYICKQLKEYEPLQPAEEIELIRKAKKGDVSARHAVVMANYRYIIYFISKYVTIPESMDFEDVINVGIEALLKAIDAYDETKKYKFITYAHWWLQKEIYEAVYKGISPLKIPLAQVKMIEKLEEYRMQKQHDEVDQGGNVIYTLVGMVEHIFEGDQVSIDRVRKAVTAAMKAINVSNDSQMGNANQECEQACYFDNYAEADESESVRNRIAAEIDVQKLLDFLSKRERDIICRYYGIGCQPQTYHEIAAYHILHPERTRQIIKESLEKIRKKWGAV